MIAFLKGKIEKIFENTVLIDVGGVGYELFVGASTRDSVKVGESTTMLTHMAVKDDGITLVGFKTEEEKALFLNLINISGIGTKSAISVLSALPVTKLVAYISSGNVDAIVKAKATGRKTAERIVLELKDKFKSLPLIEGVYETENLNNEIIESAVAVLSGLGLTKKEAELYASREYNENIKTASDLVQKVLRSL